jgi:hypothetical protein
MSKYYGMSFILWHICEASNDSSCYGTALQTSSLLGNRFVTHTNGVTEKWCSLRGPYDLYKMQQINFWERCFPCRLCPGVVRRRCLEFSELWDSRRPVRTWTRKLRKLRSWKPLSGNNRWSYTADWEYFVRAVMNCRVCELTLALQLFLITFCKRLINPITNPNPVYGHSYTWQYLWGL